MQVAGNAGGYGRLAAPGPVRSRPRAAAPPVGVDVRALLRHFAPHLLTPADQRKFTPEQLQPRMAHPAPALDGGPTPDPAADHLGQPVVPQPGPGLNVPSDLSNYGNLMQDVANSPDLYGRPAEQAPPPDLEAIRRRLLGAATGQRTASPAAVTSRAALRNFVAGRQAVPGIQQRRPILPPRPPLRTARPAQPY